MSDTQQQAQYNLQTESGDKLNQLQTMLHDRKFLVCLVIILSIIFFYLMYRYELTQFRSATQTENYIPLDNQYVDNQYNSLNRQRGDLSEDQIEKVEQSQNTESKYYSRF